MSSPSMCVMNCGSALSVASTLRQSWRAPQYSTRRRSFASCTPWDRSLTVSLSGQRVAWMRRRSSTRSSSGALNRKGRIEPSSAAVTVTSLSPVALATMPAIRDHPAPLPRHWHLPIDRFPHWSWDTGSHQPPDGSDGRGLQGTMNDTFSARSRDDRRRGDEYGDDQTKSRPVGRHTGGWAAGPVCGRPTNPPRGPRQNENPETGEK